MHFSIAKTFEQMIDAVLKIKDQYPIFPVAVILPNVSMMAGFNQALFETGKPTLNVRIETLYLQVKSLATAFKSFEGI